MSDPTLCVLGSLLLESKISPNTAYQKQQVSVKLETGTSTASHVHVRFQFLVLSLLNLNINIQFIIGTLVGHLL